MCTAIHLVNSCLFWDAQLISCWVASQLYSVGNSFRSNYDKPVGFQFINCGCSHLQKISNRAEAGISLRLSRRCEFSDYLSCHKKVRVTANEIMKQARDGKSKVTFQRTLEISLLHFTIKRHFPCIALY